ncbi:MAG: hypothetical protein LKE54_04480 [Prevotella sp.]|jgi:hypothetical protein|nr:hypothetical protein [Prevotella sp.]MCH3994299.1 hypothetical protein [Prevotella sp.]
MYQLGNIPTINDNLSEIADFIELKCFFSSGESFSLESARKIMAIESDEFSYDGVNDNDDNLYNKLTEVFAELKRRLNDCGGHYPFEIKDDTLLEIDSECSSEVKDCYLYLLFATRANMNKDNGFGSPKKYATLLFEKLSELVAQSYFGNRSKTMVFGTSEGMNFKSKVEKMFDCLNFNAHMHEPQGSTGQQKDGKLDILVWTPFSDCRDSMFIGFGQCKTGTSWEDKLSELQPSNFFGNYSDYTPIHPPARLFFLADSISEAKEKWEERTRSAGIMFDRRRIMEFLPQKLPENLFSDIRSWNLYIKQKYKL